ncbi:hypothetical protein [Rhizobium sp. BK176]|uniref:hypothetical protein n=1 Tax=Rhizobium sp. BK176 TaxID=2587071 RepID=UPI00216993A7|nr:hypothetical protein [Rhizobium sp. BK176]MCS4088444.1 hypothetical protein [Rhizobium sp. BK176]
MKIVFPLYYGITGRLPGKKQARSYAYRERIEVEIREVSTEEAPIACRWRPNTDHRHDPDDVRTNHGRSGPDLTQFTRWHENKHWKRMIMADGELRHPPMRSPELDRTQFQSMLNSGRIQFKLGVKCFPEWLTAAKDVVDDQESQFEVVKYNHREEALASMEKMLDNVIAVDGVIHAACFEPFIAVRNENREGTEVREMVIETTDRALTYARNTVASAMRIDRFDDALAVATENGTAGVDQLMGVRPEVLIPESFTFDWDMYWEVTNRINPFWTLTNDRGLGNSPLGITARSADPEERFASLSSIPDDVIENWTRARISVQPLYEALDILNDRPVNIELPTPAATAMRMK